MTQSVFEKVKLDQCQSSQHSCHYGIEGFYSQSIYVPNAVIQLLSRMGVDLTEQSSFIN